MCALYFYTILLTNCFAQIQQISNLITLTNTRRSLKLSNLNKKSESESREQEREWEQGRVWVWFGRKGKSNNNSNRGSGSRRLRKMRVFLLWSRGGRNRGKEKVLFFSYNLNWLPFFGFYSRSLFFFFFNLKPQPLDSNKLNQRLKGVFCTIQGILCLAA